MSSNVTKLMTFGHAHKYTDEEKKRFNLWAFQSQVDNLLNLSEMLDYTEYLQKHLYPLKYEIERQSKNLDKKPLLD